MSEPTDAELVKLCDSVQFEANAGEIGRNSREAIIARALKSRLSEPVVMASPSTAAAPSAAPSAVVDETGWVIEHETSAVSHPLYWAGGNRWDVDHLKAIRFARGVDAESAATYFPEVHVHRICEHSWSNHKPLPAAPVAPQAEFDEFGYRVDPLSAPKPAGDKLAEIEKRHADACASNARCDVWVERYGSDAHNDRAALLARLRAQQPQIVDVEKLAGWFTDKRGKEREGCFSTTDFCDDTHCVCKDWGEQQARALLAALPSLGRPVPTRDEMANALAVAKFGPGVIGSTEDYDGADAILALLKGEG